MSTLEYHLAELAIAKSKDDPRKVLPALPTRFDSILDIGCGAGQTLVACDLPNDVLVCGIDIDEEPVRYGQQQDGQLRLACAGGEALPFADNSFDVVISRVAVPYMHIPTALAEIARVLRPGGSIWFTLHPAGLVSKWLLKAVKSGNPKSVLYFSYVLANGALFHATGKLTRFPLNRQRCESFQTTHSITRALQTAGFRNVRTEQTAQFFVVQANKAGIRD